MAELKRQTARVAGLPGRMEQAAMITPAVNRARTGNTASAALGFQSHRLPEFAPDFLRLAVVPPEVLEQLAPERVLPILLERHALGVELPADVGQLDALVELGIANETLGILAGRDGGEVLE